MLSFCIKLKKKLRTTAGNTKPIIGTKIVGRKEADIKKDRNTFYKMAEKGFEPLTSGL